MCEFCGQKGCTLMKAEVIKHGAIIESNVEGPMRAATERMTYCFKGIPDYYSLSALFPDEEEENHHAYVRFVFDEDEGYDDEWETHEIQNPLKWQTEAEFLKNFSSINQT